MMGGENEKAVTASYEVSRLIATSGKPHTIGEDLILPAAKQMVSKMLGNNAVNTVAKLTKNITLVGAHISQQHSSNDFMNYFNSKIDTIRDQIVTMLPSSGHFSMEHI